MGRRGGRAAATPDAAASRAEVERLRGEVARLRAEAAELRARLTRAEAASPNKNTAAANAARSARAAALDAEVVETVGRVLSGLGYPLWDLRALGFPEFPGIRRLRGQGAEALNERRVPAPGGGRWSARQVQRALARYALRHGG